MSRRTTACERLRRRTIDDRIKSERARDRESERAEGGNGTKEQNDDPKSLKSARKREKNGALVDVKRHLCCCSMIQADANKGYAFSEMMC